MEHDDCETWVIWPSTGGRYSRHRECRCELAAGHAPGLGSPHVAHVFVEHPETGSTSTALLIWQDKPP